MEPTASAPGVEVSPLKALRFTLAPEDGSAMDLHNLNFWGNDAGFNGTSLTLNYQIGSEQPVKAGSTHLSNLGSPGTNGEFYSFPLSGLKDIDEPVTFTLSVSRAGNPAIFKLDDLRVDGTVRP